MYFQGRYYDPRSKRFVTADDRIVPGTGVQGFNRYAYVLNNPLRYVDSTGHSPEHESGSYYVREVQIPTTPLKVIFEFRDGEVVPKLSSEGWEYALPAVPLNESDFSVYWNVARLSTYGQLTAWLGARLLQTVFGEGGFAWNTILNAVLRTG